MKITKREADAKIAEMVMGWTHTVLKDELGFECIVQEAYGLPPKPPTPSGFQRRGFALESVPRFTTDPAASKMLRLHLEKQFDWVMEKDSLGICFELFRYDAEENIERKVSGAHEPTEELAVALCALRSVGLTDIEIEGE